MKLWYFYKNAVEKGKINPCSEYKEDFDKEMALIVNGTRDKWCKTFGEQYSDDHASDAVYFYSDKDGKYEKFHDQNYERNKKIAYNIGGIDFTQYMDKDVEIPETGKHKMEEMLLKDGKYMQSSEMAKALNVPEFDGSMSLSQYQNLVQHKMILNEMGKGFGQSAEKVVDSYATFKVYMESEGEHCPQFWAEEYRQATDDMLKKYRNSINTYIDTIAQEYADAGKKLPEADDKSYQRALDKLYTGQVDIDATNIQYHGKVNVRNILDPNHELERVLPLQDVQKMEKESKWERNFRKYMSFFKVSQEYQDNAVIACSRNKFTKIAGTFCAGIAAPVIGGISVIENKMRKNKVIHNAYRGEPKYRQWKNEDGSRVSDVQYCELPDFTKDVIKKPTKSRAREDKQVTLNKTAQKMQGAHKHLQEVRAKIRAGHGDESRTSVLEDDNTSTAEKFTAMQNPNLRHDADYMRQQFALKLRQSVH